MKIFNNNNNKFNSEYSHEHTHKVRAHTKQTTAERVTVMAGNHYQPKENETAYKKKCARQWDVGLMPVQTTINIIENEIIKTKQKRNETATSSVFCFVSTNAVRGSNQLAFISLHLSYIFIVISPCVCVVRQKTPIFFSLNLLTFPLFLREICFRAIESKNQWNRLLRCLCVCST